MIFQILVSRLFSYLLSVLVSFTHVSLCKLKIWVEKIIPKFGLNLEERETYVEYHYFREVIEYITLYQTAQNT